MPPFGPLYCETPGLIEGGFPVEPWNAISSFVIVAFGLAAFFLVRARAPGERLLLAMTALLILNGMGSVLWHGLRTRWALTLDVLPALVFVLLLAVLWARRVAPPWQVVALIAFLLIAPVAVRWIDWGLAPMGRIASSAVPIALAGLWLVVRTASMDRGIALLGAGALAAASVALAARTLDPVSCDTLAMGSHFLWHVFLSSAAFLGVLMLLALQPRGVAPSR